MARSRLTKPSKFLKLYLVGDVKNLTAAEIKQGFKDVPSYERTSGEEIRLVDLT